jgi:uncharacterized protein (DUF1501 family)
MHNPSDFQASRRDFLRRSGHFALGSAALPFALNLASIGEAAAFTAGAGDYKALVCLFLFGGNDYANTVVTYDNASYDKYSAIRGGGAGRMAGGIALGQAALTPTLLSPTAAPVDVLGVSRQFALHPSMTALAGLFNNGKAAVQLNVGPLIKPLTRTEYNSSNRTLYPRPDQLFSHNDQQSTWQSSSPEGSTVGWGGRIGDRVLATGGLNTSSVFTSISVAGNAVLLSGVNALQYQVSTSGAIKITPATNNSVYGSTALPAALKTLIQMKMVARLIKGRSTLGARRQVFFVSIGSFDMHDNLVAQHPALLGRVSDAMAALYDATVELGVENQVTSFTASDFGRTLASNGDGSDHGWGSHHFVVGGAVNGQKFYGTPPPVSVGNSTTLPDDQWHVGQGRLLPSTSVDQYAGTLAKWFGVDAGEMATVLPNLANFGGAGYPTDLGFMA